jgi:hypothetical protein
MRVSRPFPLALGLLTLWQLIYFALTFVWDFGGTGQGEGASVSGFSHMLDGLYVPTLILALGLFLFYVVHALRNDALTRKQRFVCVVVFVIASFPAELVYWWSYLWRDAALEAGKRKGGTSSAASGGEISTS